MRRKQKLIAGSLAAGGIVLALFASTFLLEHFCRLRFAENLSLREEARPESVWELRETPGGHLLRLAHGPFRGWYLAADELVNDVPELAAVRISVGIFPVREAHVRNLILRDRQGTDCLWRLTETEGGLRLQPARGRYEGWYLGYLKDYIPDTGHEPRVAWNLILTEAPTAWSEWRRTAADGGILLQATGVTGFTGWYLDCLHAANVLERNRCWGQETPRDGPAPPLAR